MLTDAQISAALELLASLRAKGDSSIVVIAGRRYRNILQMENGKPTWAVAAA